MIALVFRSANIDFFITVFRPRVPRKPVHSFLFQLKSQKNVFPRMPQTSVTSDNQMVCIGNPNDWGVGGWQRQPHSIGLQDIACPNMAEQSNFYTLALLLNGMKIDGNCWQMRSVHFGWSPIVQHYGFCFLHYRLVDVRLLINGSISIVRCPRLERVCCMMLTCQMTEWIDILMNLSACFSSHSRFGVNML